MRRPRAGGQQVAAAVELADPSRRCAAPSSWAAASGPPSSHWCASSAAWPRPTPRSARSLPGGAAAAAPVHPAGGTPGRGRPHGRGPIQAPGGRRAVAAEQLRSPSASCSPHDSCPWKRSPASSSTSLPDRSPNRSRLTTWPANRPRLRAVPAGAAPPRPAGSAPRP